MSYKLSVIVPFYNKEKTAAKTFDSLINQTIFKDIELICIDDGSKDNTLKIMKKYASKYPNIKIFQNEKNLKVYKTKLRGIAYATGDYIGFIDVDDWIDKGYFEELYNKAIETGADITQTKATAQYFGKDKPIMNGYDFLCLHVPDGTYEITPEFISDYCTDAKTYMLWQSIFKKDLLKQCLRLPPLEKVDLIEDVLILFDCFIRGNLFTSFTGTQFYYYDRSDEVEHESGNRAKDPKISDTCFALTFSLIDSILLNGNHMEYKPALRKIQSQQKFFRTREFNKLFQRVENFDGTTNYIIPRYLVPYAKRLEKEIKILSKY